MTIRRSTGLTNAILGTLGFMGAMNGCYMEIYTGSQPASADALKTGTRLGVVTASSATLTKETRATGSITLTGGSSGSINTLTVGGLNVIPDGAVAYNTSLNQTAADLCEAINRNGIMEATVSSATVTLMGRPGTGVTTAAVTASLTTITASYVNMGSGVAGVAPVNGLRWVLPTAGIVAKPTNQVWSFTGEATGVAGWGRLYASNTADSGALLSGAPWYPRLDFSVGTSGADLNLANVNIVSGAPNTVDQFQFSLV